MFVQEDIIHKIKLVIEEAGEVDRKGWPITQGIPFPDGQLEKGQAVRIVDKEGKILPVQSSCLTTWQEDQKYVKWLLVDFQCDLPGNSKQEVWLEYGPGVGSVIPEQPVEVKQTDSRTLIDTGVIRFELHHDSPDFLSAYQVKTEKGWRDLCQNKAGPHLYMIDQKGHHYQSGRYAPAPQITVEEYGPMRACVCIRGYLASDEGLRFCPFVLRIHAYAGKDHLKFYHTFIFDQAPDLFELRAVGMFFPLDVGDDIRMSFGGQDKSHYAKHQESAHFMQVSDKEYRVTLDGIVSGSGATTQGWACLSGTKGNVVVVMRDLWKEYPKGIGLSTEGLDLQFWPEEYEEPLRFSTSWKEKAIYFSGTREEKEVKRLLEENPTAPLNLKSFRVQSEEDLKWVEKVIAKYAPDRVASHNDTGTDNGIGAAKTHEFVLRFASKPVQEIECESLGRAIQEPVIAPPEPEYMSRTGALRLFHHYDPIRFPEAEQGLEDIFETVVVEPREVLRTYGMIDYGDLMCSHSPGPCYAWRLYRNDDDPIEGMKHCSRAYNNEANDQVYALWCNFAHTGGREYFLAAEAYSEHMADVDIIHLHPGEPSCVGLMHYHNCHHWTGDASPSHTCTAGLMLHYYFTGNRRLLDVVLEVADWVVRHQEPCGILSNREGALYREFSTPLANLLEAYQATWAKEYGDLARRSLQWFLKTQPEPGNIPMSVYTRGERGDEAWVEHEGWLWLHAGGMLPNILYDSVRLFNDKLATETLIGYANHWVWHRPVDNFYTAEIARKWLTSVNKLYKVNNTWFWEGWLLGAGFNAAIIAYAYELTGDPIYAAYCRHYMMRAFPFQAKRIAQLSAVTFTSVCYGSIVPPMMAATAMAMEKCPKALEEADNIWRKRRREMGSPIYDGPYEWIPVDQAHFDANGNVIGMEPSKLFNDIPGIPRPPARPLGIIACDL